MLNNKQIKINVSNDAEYRQMTSTINNSDLEWHTYENKANRPSRVMARNLHPSCDVKAITEELTQNGFKILSVVQKLKKIGKNNEDNQFLRLPLYMLTFEHSEDINKIFAIRYLNHMKVKIEAIRTNKLIAQCKKCQRYGHTQKFCNHSPTCVRCAGNHLTADCTKPRNTPAKCVNCNEAHPANYRGYTIAKELQKRRNEATKSKKTIGQPKTFTSNMVKADVPFSKILQNKQEKATHDQEPSMILMMQNIMKTLEQVNQRLDNLEAKNTGAIPKRK